MRHYDVYGNKTKAIKNVFSIMTSSQTHYHFKLDFQEVYPQAGGQWLRNQTLEGQSVAKPGTPLYDILVENLNMT